MNQLKDDGLKVVMVRFSSESQTDEAALMLVVPLFVSLRSTLACRVNEASSGGFRTMPYPPCAL